MQRASQDEQDDCHSEEEVGQHNTSRRIGRARVVKTWKPANSPEHERPDPQRAGLTAIRAWALRGA